MSQWTHINAMIRIDDLNMIFTGRPAFSKEQVLEIIKGYSPSGSEGGLDFQVIRGSENYSEGGEQNSYWIAIAWGDLRDFGNEDLESVEKWKAHIEDSIKGKAIIRQMDICCSVESSERKYFKESQDE